MLGSLLSSVSGIFCFMLYLRMQNIYEKPLSAAEERKCLQAAAAGDASARDTLIRRNLRLIAHVVKKYNAPADTQDDLISIGTVGLIKAVDSFSLEKGSRFSTYAARCIENEILMYFRARKKRAGDRSLSDVIDIDKEGNELTLMDIIAGEDTIAEDLEKKIEIEKMLRAVREELDEREQKVIALRYGLSGRPPLSQQQTGERLGISRSYISRIENKALRKMRRAMEEKK